MMTRHSPTRTLSQRQQRRAAHLSVLAVVLWVLLSATHLHSADVVDAPGQAETACAICVSLPGSAPLPDEARLPARSSAATPVPESPAHRVVSGRSSSYRSRAPPAA